MRNLPTYEQFLFEGGWATTKTQGTTIKYKSESDLLKAVVDQYEKKMMTIYNSSKFEKAQTPAAVAAMNKVRSLVEEYVQKAKDELK